MEGNRPIEIGSKVEDIIGNMDMAGVNKTLILPVSQWKYGDTNREVSLLIRDNPDKLIGFGRVDPNCPECAYSDALVAVKDLGLKGLEVSGFNWVNYDPSIASPLFVRLFTLDVPVLIREDIDQALIQRTIPQVVDRFRDKTIIAALSPWAGQTFYFQPYREALVDMAKASENFFLIVSTVVMSKNIEEIIARVGAEQIIFGSNAPNSNPIYEIARIEALNLSDEDKEMILGGNIARILGVSD